jgi:hypothetical protein
MEGVGLYFSFLTQHKIEIIGQPQAPTALPLGKELEVPIELEAGWALELLWTL